MLEEDGGEQGAEEGVSMASSLLEARGWWFSISQEGPGRGLLGVGSRLEAPDHQGPGSREGTPEL